MLHRRARNHGRRVSGGAQKDFQPETRAGGLVIASVGIYTKNIIAMLA